MLVGLWIARNHALVGSPVLTTEAGLSLWIAHNDSMMTLYPNRSVDEVNQLAWQRLSPQLRDHLDAAASDPVRLDRIFAGLAWSYIREHPLRAAADGAARAVHAFSGWLSPARQWPIQLSYAALFLPINVLALAGLWRAVKSDQRHAVMLPVFASVALTAGVFWMHTSHQSYLDVFRMIYASSILAPILERVGYRRVN